MRKSKLLPLVVFLVALLGVPPAAGANGPLMTNRSRDHVGVLEGHIYVAPGEYWVDSMHVRLRGCRPWEPGVEGCTWELTGIQARHGDCAAASLEELLDHGTQPLFHMAVHHGLTLSVKHRALDYPPGQIGPRPLCWFVKIPDHGAELLAESRLGR